MSAANTRTQPDDLARFEEVLEHFEQLEVQLRQVRSGLTHSHRLATLGTIATTIAHEFNNILTPIISYAQLALASPDDAANMRKAVEKALAGAERAAHVSASVLGFAREGDSRDAAPLREVIRDTIATLAREPAKDGIDLRVDVPDALVAMSPLELQQVLLNLILNARRAMQRTGGSLSITGRLAEDVVLLDVADTGPGIPDAIRERLFEPFVTMHEGGHESDGQKGTGLGLSICRDLLRDAGGAIDVSSTPGQGAVFHIRAPLACDPDTKS